MPGFSYLAIAPKQTPSQMPVPQIEQIIAVDEQVVTPESVPAIPTIEQTVLLQSAENTSELPATVAKTGISWLPIAAAAVAIMVFAGIGLVQYRRFHGRKLTQDDPILALRGYISLMRAKGMEESEVRKRLFAVGWDHTLVDQELTKPAAKPPMKPPVQQEPAPLEAPLAPKI